MDLTIKNVIFWNSTLVTYTYIYKKKIDKYLHWIFVVCFTRVMWVKKNYLLKLRFTVLVHQLCWQPRIKLQLRSMCAHLKIHKLNTLIKKTNPGVKDIFPR